MFEYTSDATRKVHSFQAHLESCRAVKFVGDGSLLLSGSADCSILAMDSATGQVRVRPVLREPRVQRRFVDIRAGRRR